MTEAGALSPAAPAPERHKTTEAAVDPVRAIPAAHVPCIRIWVKYGMTIAQVATVYGVHPAEIARRLGKA